MGVGNSVKAVLVLLLLGLWLGVGAAGAQPPTPNFMPNFPMLAGPQVMVMWLPVPGAVKYRVYMNGEQVAESPAPQYMAAAPTAAGEYVFEVTALDAAGGESAKSQPGKISIITLEPPKDIVGRPDPAKKAVTLRWSATPGLLIYNVFRSTAADGEFSLVTSVQETSYIDPNLEPGTYHYKVSGKSAAGKESEPSPVVSVELAAPAVVVAARPVNFAIQKTEEVKRVEILGDLEIKNMGGLAKVDGSDLAALHRDAKLMSFFNVKSGDTAGDPVPVEFTPNGVSVAPDGSIWVPDMLGNLHVYSSGMSAEVQTIAIQRPPQEDQEFWKTIPERVHDMIIQASYVSFVGEEVWVSIPRLALINVYDLDGNLLRYLWRYTSQQGKLARFAAPGVVLGLPNGNAFVTFPVARTHVALDADMKETFNVGLARKGLTGGFMGFGGATLSPDGKAIFILDSIVNSIQAFSSEDGGYLFAVGDKSGKVSSLEPGVAEFPYTGLITPVFDAANNLCFIAGGDEAVICLRFVGDPVLMQ